MSAVIPGYRGLREIVSEQMDSFSMRTGQEAKRDRRRAAAFHYLTPVAPAALMFVPAVHIYAPGDILTGLAVLTGLLFALLVLVWTEGVKARQSGAWSASSRVVTLLNDLRANVTYASTVSLVLIALLVVVSTTTPPAANGDTPTAMAPLVAAPLAWLVGHLILALGLILRRLRAAYMELSDQPPAPPKPHGE